MTKRKREAQERSQIGRYGKGLKNPQYLQNVKSEIAEVFIQSHLARKHNNSSVWFNETIKQGIENIFGKIDYSKQLNFSSDELQRLSKFRNIQL